MKDSTSGLTEASEGGWAIRDATLYIHEESDEFQSDTYDGLLRLAFPAILNLNHNLFFFTRRRLKIFWWHQKMVASGAQARPVRLGALHWRHRFGPLHGAQRVPRPLYLEWLLGNRRCGASASVGEDSVADRFDTIIDSGSTIITAPTDAAQSFQDKVYGLGVYDEWQGLYTYPYDSPPEVALSWGGKVEGLDVQR